MSEFWYIYSNGRCGTQLIARQLSIADKDARVIHEPVSRQMASRIVYRDPEALYSQLGRSPDVQRYLVRADSALKNGTRFINCGWPAFAWLDYFDERFGEKFRFIHLVRNPYDAAASHSTHLRMMPPVLDELEKKCKLFGTDPNLKFKQFADRYIRFGTFERQLLHWLEVTTFACEHQAAPGYRGLFRFEEIVANDCAGLNDLMSLVLGRKTDVSGVEPFDRVHTKCRWPLDFHVDPELREKVDALAIRLGYTQEALERSLNADRLQEIYSSKRFDLPCDPAIPVVVNHRNPLAGRGPGGAPPKRQSIRRN